MAFQGEMVACMFGGSWTKPSRLMTSWRAFSYVDPQSK